MEGEGVTMGKAAHYLGAVGTGSKMKLVVNMTMGTMMNSLVSDRGDGRQEVAIGCAQIVRAYRKLLAGQLSTEAR